MATGVETHENGFVCYRSRVLKWAVTQRLNMFNPQREKERILSQISGSGKQAKREAVGLFKRIYTEAIV